MKKNLLIGAIAFILLVFAVGLYVFHMQATIPGSTQAPLQSVQLDGKTIHVAIADTEAKRELGLGGRTSLASDEGMLFVFPQDGKYAFWMKDMSFSIDIVWIAQNGSIVYIASNVAPDTYPTDFVPTSAARYVLELPANYVQTNNVKVGDVVVFK